jgi:hypothetical protein
MTKDEREMSGQGYGAPRPMPKTAMTPSRAIRAAPKFPARPKIGINQSSTGVVHTPLIK